MTSPSPLTATRMSFSGTSIRRTSTPGSGGPDAADVVLVVAREVEAAREKGCTATAGEASVMPQPWSSGRPRLRKSRAVCGFRAAPPLTRKRSLPPSALWMGRKTQRRQVDARQALDHAEALLPASAACRRRPSASARARRLRYMRSYRAGTPKKIVGLVLLQAVADAAQVVLDDEARADQRRQDDRGDERHRVVQRQHEQDASRRR